MLNILNFTPILDRPDLVSPSVVKCVKEWKGVTPVNELWVTQINPEFAKGSDFCNQYGFKYTEGANCVIVEGHRGSTKIMAACVIPVGCKTDFNGVARKHLQARRVSLGNLDNILKETGMEYGSITPVGLPSSWLILVDKIVATESRVVIGSGLLRSKLSVPGAALLELDNSHLIVNLATPV